MSPKFTAFRANKYMHHELDILMKGSKLCLDLEIMSRSAHKQLLKNILNIVGKPDSEETASLSLLTGLPITAAVCYQSVTN